MKENSTFYTLNEVINSYIKIAFEDLSYEQLVPILTSGGCFTKEDYDSILERYKIDEKDIITAELKKVYQITSTTYRCEYDINVLQYTNSDLMTEKEEKSAIEKFENISIIKINPNKKLYKVLYNKFTFEGGNFYEK